MEINPLIAAKALAVGLVSTGVVAYKFLGKGTFGAVMLGAGAVLGVALSEAKIMADKKASNSYYGRSSPNSGPRPQYPCGRDGSFNGSMPGRTGPIPTERRFGNPNPTPGSNQMNRPTPSDHRFGTANDAFNHKPQHRQPGERS